MFAIEVRNIKIKLFLLVIIGYDNQAVKITTVFLSPVDLTFPNQHFQPVKVL